MSSKEILASEGDWEPMVTIRAHHVRLYMGSHRLIKTLLRHRLYNPINFASSVVSSIGFKEDHRGYILDTYGAYGTPSYNQIKQAETTIEGLLEGLSDDDTVQIGLGKDHVCNSCAIGKHCEATNYKERGQHIDFEKFDLEDLNTLHKRLLRKKLQEGVDFKLVPTTEVFNDYQGQKLWMDNQPAIPRIVEYNAILVKMGALRKVV